MINQIFLYVGAFLPIIWGIIHIFPTKSVVKGFGDISIDNKRIITMEWLIEGVTLIFVGIITLSITLIEQKSSISTTLYWIMVIQLNVLSLVSLFTGFKIKFLPYRLCPLIFTSSSLFVVLGLLL